MKRHVRKLLLASACLVTTGTYAAQFETAPWVKAVHDDPICAASGL